MDQKFYVSTKSSGDATLTDTRVHVREFFDQAKPMTATKTIVVTFGTMITILTIEIHDNLCNLTIKSDIGQHSQFLRCFLLGSMGILTI